jgi:hypothetical protein
MCRNKSENGNVLVCVCVCFFLSTSDETTNRKLRTAQQKTRKHHSQIQTI